MDDIWAYMAALASNRAADDVIDRFMSRLRLVATNPGAGAPRDVLATRLRVVFCRPYALYYRHTTDEVLVVRVLHGARDVAALARDGGLAGEAE